MYRVPYVGLITYVSVVVEPYNRRVGFDGVVFPPERPVADNRDGLGEGLQEGVGVGHFVVIKMLPFFTCNPSGLGYYLGMNSADIIIVNNTNANISMFIDAVVSAAKAGTSLPEEIADIFTMKIVNIGEKVRVIINWA